MYGEVRNIKPMKEKTKQSMRANVWLLSRGAGGRPIFLKTSQKYI
jgi:hypothetical protein